jgi:hypothetical protein
VESFALLKHTPPTMAEQPPPYGQESCLDPGLKFNAQAWRDHFRKRDRAFAKAIVKFIADYADKEELFENSRGYAYRNSEDGKTLNWDKAIGYPATLAFKTKRVRFIVKEAMIDLGKRGFVVEKLELVMDNANRKSENEKQECKKTALNCKCGYHGIFVSWKLGIGDQ